MLVDANSIGITYVGGITVIHFQQEIALQAEYLSTVLGREILLHIGFFIYKVEATNKLPFHSSQCKQVK
jgi:hypothetical protein